MSKIKTIVVLTCTMLGFVNAAKGQIYENEACFYAPAGSSKVRTVVRFEGSQNRVWEKNNFIPSKLAESPYYYENENWTDGKGWVRMYEYDYSKSTSQRVVYKHVTKKAIYSSSCAGLGGGCLYYGSHGCGRHGYKEGDYTYYVAFSKDKSSYFRWTESKNDVGKTPRNKDTFTRVPKEDLLPKAANYDFLNE